MLSRVEEAVKTFESGYNCAQSVFATYADLFGIDKETALKMSSSMGGGIGRMREVCGVVSAMALLAGLKEGNADPDDEEAKEAIYLLTRQMADKFKEKHQTIICRELLELPVTVPDPTPSKRTEEFYKARPWIRFVETAALIMENVIESKE